MKTNMNAQPENTEPTSVIAQRTSSSSKADPMETSSTVAATSKRGLRFWMVLSCLALSSMMVALEATITGTALPSIDASLQMGVNYTWIANMYFLMNLACTPLFGQIADLFGRRWPMIFAVTMFTLGSGWCGGSRNLAMFLIGRGIQGIGGGGVVVLVNMIVSDLVPLRERGPYLAIIYIVFSLGTGLGPFIGGILSEKASWRWVFYIQLPIGGTSLAFLVLFLKLKHSSFVSPSQRLRQVDFIGTFLIAGAVSAILISLSWAGVRYPWKSSSVLVPLIVGCLGIVAFIAYESSPFCVLPSTPPRLFKNRTSVAGFAITFIHGMLNYWVLYMLPIYFQGVLLSTQLRSGVQLLPTVLVLLPAAMAAVVVLTKSGEYKILHIIAGVLMTIGLGLLMLLNQRSTVASWASYQIIIAIGSGIYSSTTLPAVQAYLPDSDTAVVTATWSFVRYFGSVWGLAVPGIIFTNRFDRLALQQISDNVVRNNFTHARSIALAGTGTIRTLPEPAKSQIISVFAGSFRPVWLAAMAIAALLLPLAMVERRIALRQELDTEYGMQDKTEASDTIVRDDGKEIEADIATKV